MISPRIFIWFQLFHRTAHDRPDKRQQPGQASWHAAVRQTAPASVPSGCGYSVHGAPAWE